MLGSTRIQWSSLVAGLLIGLSAGAASVAAFWPAAARTPAGHRAEDAKPLLGMVAAEDFERLKTERDAANTRALEATNEAFHNKMEALSRRTSSNIGLGFIEAIASSAEDASKKSGFWTEYRLDNVKVAAACRKASALIRVADAAIDASDGSQGWGTGACFLRLEPKGTAALCGLTQFDVLVRYGSTPINNPDDVERAKKFLPAPGAPVDVVIVRGSKAMKVSIARGNMGVYFD